MQNLIKMKTTDNQERIERLKSMIRSCFAYEDYGRSGYNFQKYIHPHLNELGEELFNNTYESEVKRLEENYTVRRNTYTDAYGLTYNTLIEKT